MVLRAPRIRVNAYGDAEAHDVFRAFTARHRRFKMTSAKKWGVALMALPDTGDAYLASVSRQARRARAKAMAAGYHYRVVDPKTRIDEIIAIHASTPSRQGRPMAAGYLDPADVAATVGSRAAIHGVLDGDGVLQAYGHVLDIGDAFTFTFLIGHADRLKDGIMYLLVESIVRACVADRRPDGSPRWLMADTFWGASDGLAYFKERTGFQAYTVSWVWTGNPPCADPR